MPDVELDKDLRPTITSENQLLYAEGRGEEEQNLRLDTIDRLFGVLSQVAEEDIENRIRVTLRRVARDHEYLDAIQTIDIDRKQGGYDVYIEFIENEDFSFTVEDT